jgi:hypothetical protein
MTPMGVGPLGVRRESHLRLWKRQTQLQDHAPLLARPGAARCAICLIGGTLMRLASSILLVAGALIGGCVAAHTRNKRNSLMSS